jgi:hypothetical protein
MYGLLRGLVKRLFQKKIMANSIQRERKEILIIIIYFFLVLFSNYLLNFYLFGLIIVRYVIAYNWGNKERWLIYLYQGCEASISDKGTGAGHVIDVNLKMCKNSATQVSHFPCKIRYLYLYLNLYLYLISIYIFNLYRKLFHNF